MRARVNDCLRRVIGLTIAVLGIVSTLLLRFRMLGYARNQERLKRKYGITRDTRVLPYGPQVVQSIQTAALKLRSPATFAKTSGTTGKAKEILYTKRRLLALKLTFSEMFARACYAFGVKRTSLYVFNSFQTDASLTSLLLDENELPNYFSTLQAPYRVQQNPAAQTLVSKYGPAAVRLWILSLSNPGVLYSTNPSTISTFLDELADDWRGSSKLIRDWCQSPASFPPEVHKIARRLESCDCAKRLNQIANCDVALPLSICAPAVEAYICWTGGYVKPFLDRLEKHLPSSHYRLIPMYSMSTETIETLPDFRRDASAFLPMADGVVYEFIEETDVDDPENLLSPQQLEPGKLYAMVVSDGYGLRRYQTDDLFVCKRVIAGLPDLTFARRRGLEYSFTGEKLTGAQLSTVFDQLRALYPALLAEVCLTCVPSESRLPHYKVLLIGRQHSSSLAGLAASCDKLLCDINFEYKSKRATGRLGPIECIDIQFKEFAERFAPAGIWESQFKILPLHRASPMPAMHSLASKRCSRVS